MSIAARLSAEIPPKKINICSTFAVSANMGLMRDWIRESMATPLEMIYESVNELLAAILAPSVLEAVRFEAGLR